MTVSTREFLTRRRWYVSSLVAIMLIETQLAAQVAPNAPVLGAAAPAVTEPLVSTFADGNRTQQQVAQQDSGWYVADVVRGESVEPMPLTLDQSRAMILNNSRVLRLAALAVQQSRFAQGAARTDYLPKVLGTAWYFHFNSDLGTVVTTPGVFLPATAVSVPIVEQDASGGLLSIVQPITPLLKVRQAVNIASADVWIAETNVVKARRELLKGIEELYFALYVVQQGRELAQTAVGSAEQMAQRLQSPLANLAVIQAKQGLQTVEGQIAELTAQLNNLLELPLNTELHLALPNPIDPPMGGEEEAIAFALASSPQIGEARANVAKAAAAVKLAQADFVPTVAVMGVYSAQDTTELIQDDFSGIGITASHTLFEWGKKKQTLCQQRTTLALAQQNLRHTIETVRVDALTAYRTFGQTARALAYAEQAAKIYGQMPLPMDDPKSLIEEVKQRATAQTAVGTAQVAHRKAFAALMAVTGQIDQYLR